jgi:hypothetical protein
MCVSMKHGLVVTSNHDAKNLSVFSLADGTLLRSIGRGGRGKGEFRFFWGGLCASPDGDSVLVAEYWNDRVQQVDLTDGSWVRFIGEGMLNRPQHVDCNADVIVVSEFFHRVSVWSWTEGLPVAQFGRCCRLIA